MNAARFRSCPIAHSLLDRVQVASGIAAPATGPTCPWQHTRRIIRADRRRDLSTESPRRSISATARNYQYKDVLRFACANVLPAEGAVEVRILSRDPRHARGSAPRGDSHENLILS